jgi:hypothetical protein
MIEGYDALSLAAERNALSQMFCQQVGRSQGIWRLGKTYGNLMMDVAQHNIKLQNRVRRIVTQTCDVDGEQVAKALEISVEICEPSSPVFFYNVCFKRNKFDLRISL